MFVRSGQWMSDGRFHRGQVHYHLWPNLYCISFQDRNMVVGDDWRNLILSMLNHLGRPSAHFSFPPPKSQPRAAWIILLHRGCSEFTPAPVLCSICVRAHVLAPPYLVGYSRPRATNLRKNPGFGFPLRCKKKDVTMWNTIFSLCESLMWLLPSGPGKFFSFLLFSRFSSPSPCARSPVYCAS